MTNQIESAIKSVIADQFAYPKNELSSDTHLHEDIGIDSAAFVELAVRLEDVFKIKLPPFDNLKTVGDVLDCVSANIKEYDI